MTAGVDLERSLAGWLEAEAPAHAPDRLLPAVLGRVGTTPQRWSVNGTRLRIGRLSRTTRLVLALASLVLLGAAIVLVGTLVPQVPTVERFEAVFVRGEGPVEAPDLVLVTVDIDGRERVLARFDASSLPGAVSPDRTNVSAGGWVVTTLAMDGFRTFHAVLDLRRPQDPPRVVDIEGGSATWGPDERLAINLNAGGYGLYDPLTGVSSIVRSSDTSIEGFLNLLWTADGSGLVGASPEGSYGVLRTEGTFVTGPAAWFEDGIATTRVSATGTRLNCDFNEPACTPEESLIVEGLAGQVGTVWHRVPAGWLIVELGWGTGGSTGWAIVERVAGTEREVQLLRLDAPDAVTTIGTWAADPDDPDESSYIAGASVAGVAPDGSMAVLSVAGRGVRLIDVASRRDVLVAGSFAGWLSSTRLGAARQPERLVTPIAQDLHGTWAAQPQGTAGVATLTVDGTRMSLTTGDRTVDLTAALQPDGAVSVRQPRDLLGCGPDSTATYRLALEEGRLTLAAIDDACEERRGILAGAWERGLPRPDTGSPVVGPGTYLGSLEGRRYRVSVPAPGATVFSASERGVDLSLDGDGTVRVRAFRASEGHPDACADDGPTVPLSTPDQARAHLEALPGVDVGPAQPIELGAAAGSRMTVTVGGATAACLSEHRTGIWPQGEGRFRGYSISGTNEVVFLTLDDGGVLVLVATIGPETDPGGRAWAEALLGSFDIAP